MSDCPCPPKLSNTRVGAILTPNGTVLSTVEYIPNMIVQRVAGLLQGELVHHYFPGIGVMAYYLTHNNLEYEASSDDETAVFELDIGCQAWQSQETFAGLESTQDLCTTAILEAAWDGE